MAQHPECIKWRQRGEQVLAGGPGTFSKHPSRYPQGIAPFALVAGEGCWVIGSNGQAYIDTVAALGAITLGYNYPVVTRAIVEQAARGCSFSMVHPLEIEVGEMLCDMIPGAEMIRFCRNGTDATHTAVRLARAITGKRHVLFIGYHGGGGDSYGSTTDKQAGILPSIHDYNHQKTWESWQSIDPDIWDDLACIMTEVPALPWEIPSLEYKEKLAAMAHIAHSRGALMILDEVVSFPRAGLEGSQGVYGEIPDITCISKGIANGMPLAAVVGKREYMERLNHGDIFASWTFAGETTALAACKATLELIRKPHIIQSWHNYGRQYGNALADLLCGTGGKVYGHDWRIVVRWNDIGGVNGNVLRTLWLQEHAKHGVLNGIGAIFPMVCWDDHILEKLISTASNVSGIIRESLRTGKIQEIIECPVIEDVIRAR